MEPPKTRPYRSRRRQENAEETRRRILRSARKLIVTRGFGGTTVDAIAKGAGVAVQTVYAVFGSKHGILIELHDHLAYEADYDALNAALAAAEGNPRQQLRERIAFNMRYYSRGADLIEAARSASGVDKGLAELWKRGEDRRYARYMALVQKWADDGDLRPGADVSSATDMWWALASPDLYRLFVVERGWPEERFAQYLFTTMEQELFGRETGDLQAG